VTWHLWCWYYRASDMIHTSGQSPLYLGTWLARRIHFPRFWHVFRMLHNVLYMVMSDSVQWSWVLPPLVHSFWTTHQSILWRCMAHPIGECDFHKWASFCSLLVVHNLQL
jgi:hypothetical protein